MTREELFRLVNERYGVREEYPWADDNAIMRHTDNRKWFAAVLRVKRDRLGLDGEGIEDVLDVKCDPDLIGAYRRESGVLRAYHMNKEHWVTILLSVVPADRIAFLLDGSFHLTENKKCGKSF